MDSALASVRQRGRPMRPLFLAGGLGLFLAWAFLAVDWEFGVLFDGPARSRAFERMGRWLDALLRPDLSLETLELGWILALQTLSAALLGTGLAVLLGWLIGLGSSRAVWAAGLHGRLLSAGFRILQDVLRSVPCFVWAVLLVPILGLGPLTGAFALALNTAGILGKVYGEIWDGIEKTAYAQVRAMGGSRMATFLYGTRPLGARAVLSFTLMRAECAIRNASVIGVVGGGGLGADIWYQIGLGRWDTASTLILFTLVLTLSADLAATFIRRQLCADPAHSAGRSRVVPGRLRPYLGAGLALGSVLWAVWFMGWGDNAPPGQQRKNFLAPALGLVQGESWRNLRLFEGLLRPEFGLRGAEAPEEPEPRLAAGGQDGAGPFAWRVVRSAAVPLAMALVSSVVGALLAMLLAFPHSVAFQVEPALFTGERAHPLARAGRLLLFAGARLAALVARGVPDVLWAFLFIAFFGPGLLAGAAALAVHSMGVLLRVFSEAVDDIPYRRFEQGFLGSLPACFVHLAVPIAWRQWLVYAFFQFESNVRAGVVLGIIGVGGLGFLFSVNFEFFQLERASTCLIAIVLLTVAIDRISRLLSLARTRR